jgi:hypothetical protein
MDTPILDLTQRDNEEFYAFIGRVCLLLVEYNVDAITAATFVREIAAAGGSALSLEQAMDIASSYVNMARGGLNNEQRYVVPETRTG